MRIVFLGGAGGIGASCIAVQTGEHWLLVDAGIRMDPRADRLPDLAFLQDKSLAAIFVTHAHADHIGALPLVQQAFPATPIYASRATMLLMEVMLDDALTIMAKRASDALEVPLYGEAEVAATVQMLRPLPLSGSVVVPELPDVTVYTARAGHVAGALSLGLEAADGRLVISGDVSVTPQRTVPGAALVGLQHPDLMVLESTYGSRLHPNRQSEEERLAQTVAEGIERGGHVLIPAFALGRAQEVIRILHDAQRRGRIPEFPIWVDGLVRTVCATYTAIPEALTATLERQIRRGYAPFFGGMVRAVSEPRQRDKILQGAPSCIVTSSGMLTGGPSAYYAAHLASDANNSILITGYQDEESPGRKLLALADQDGGTLEVGGQSVPVRCHFGRYSLSAHADGGELAGMVSALKPRSVALVHGDGDARGELAQRLERLTSVLLPTEGQQLDITPGSARAVGGRRQQKPRRRNVSEPTVLSGEGIGAGAPLQPDDLPRLWQTISDHSGEQVASVRELALAWYGSQADPAADDAVRAALETDQRFFVPHPDLPDMVRVRAPAEVDAGVLAPEQPERHLRPGALLLLRLYGDRLLPALCLDVRAEVIRAYTPAGEGQRTRFPRANVCAVVGTWPDYPVADAAAARDALADLHRAAQQWQRQRPLRTLVEPLEGGRSYSMDELWEQVGAAPDDLVARLAVAMLLNANPDVVQPEDDASVLPQRTRYRVLSGETMIQALKASDPRPDQTAILATIERHIGNPPDLYRRSVNPETGAVTLAFHFPVRAQQQYAEALAAAAAEAGVTVELSPRPHQGALAEAAQAVLPAGLEVLKTSLHHNHETVTLRVSGEASSEACQEAAQQFAAQTGWTLQLEGLHGISGSAPEEAAPPLPAGEGLDMNQATALIKGRLGPESGCYKISIDQPRRTLTVRFHFPDAARERYADTLAELVTQTGWHIMIYPEPHQGELDKLVRRVLPAGLTPSGAPSLYRDERRVVVRCQGTADEDALREAQEAFAATTGWSLETRQP
jgi:Cft2 family RNA processing exonuclease